MEKKNNFWKGALCGALAMFLVTGIGFGGYQVARMLFRGDGIERRTEKKVSALRQLMDDKFLYDDQISDEVLQESLIKGYVAGLADPYSVYYDKEETKELMESVEGQFGGIGVSITQSPEGLMTFVTVYEEGAGAEAGFQSGDILYKIDGVDVSGMDLNRVVTMIKGEEGTDVEITVLRGADLEEYTATATRKIVEIHTIEYKMLPDAIGYIQVTEFDSVTAEQFLAAIEDLKKQNMQGLVIDLRNNPGGSMETVCTMLDALLPKGTIVSTKDKFGKGDVQKSDEEHQLKLPMSVLINGHSASASEIFAGAMQDYKWATIVGTTSFGKGIVQQIFPMTDGTSIKLTISEYFTPDGRNIHGKGIEPDVEVAYEYDEEQPEKDNQLDKAVEVVKEQIK